MHSVVGISPYFINPNLGFIFEPGVDYSQVPEVTGRSPKLNRTTDGGNSWTSLDQFNALGFGIAQIYFVSPAHGYLAAIGFANQGGLFETNDTGSHWQKISIGIQGFQSVYASAGNVFATMYSTATGWQRLLMTRNDGLSWDTVLTVNEDSLIVATYVTGNDDSLVCLVRLDPNNVTHLEYSTNCGSSWRSSLLDSNYFWNVVTLFAFPHSMDILRQYVGTSDEQNDTYSFLHSRNNQYSVWDASLLHKETGAWIAGTSCVQYLASASDSKPGVIMRSADHGVSWARIVGPVCWEIDDIDFRNISVVGHGAVVYESDNGGVSVPRLYCTTDGGDGTLSESQLSSKMYFGHELPATSSNDTIIASDCRASNILLFFQNLNCSYSAMNLFSLTGLDSSEYSYTLRHHTFDKSLPDTVILKVTPANGENRTVTATLHFIDDEYNTFDTSYTFVVLGTGGVSIDIGIYVKPTPITGFAGDTIEIPIYVNNPASLLPISIAGATSGSAQLSLNTNLLGSLTFPPALAGVASGALTVTPSGITIPLTAPNGFSFTGETLLGNLRGVLCLADSSHTSVTVSQSTFTSADPRCIVESLDSNAIQITVGRRCGDTTLLRYMANGQLPFDILAITPNPASNSLQVLCDHNAGIQLSYQMFDALGRERMNGMVNSTELSLDVSMLPVGTYFFRMSDSHGNTLTRTVGVVK
jgi:photosystem II stability/assembly factor-like uncharacterized protein